jgi:hypothetical protein
MQDPIVDVLDDLCCQSHGSFTSYELKISYDQDMIRQSVAWPGLARSLISKFSKKFAAISGIV